MIRIFKTSVTSKKQVAQLKPHINALLPGVRWNFDLEDCDRILRIESNTRTVLKIPSLLASHQFYCEELF